MKKIIYTILFFFIYGGFITTQAQVTFSASEVEVCENGTAIVEFSINSNQDIFAFQYAVTWDENILTNPTLNDAQLGSSYSDFNSTPPGTNNGTIEGDFLKVGWFNSGSGLDFSQPIFSISFDMASAGTSIIDITAFPDYLVFVANPDGSNLDASLIDLVDGSVSFGDTENPVITNCPDNINITIPVLATTGTATWTDVTATDNCALNSLVGSHTSGEAFTVGITNVSFLATDDAGNTSNCNFIVTVINEVVLDPFTINISEETTGCEDLQVHFDFTTLNFTNMEATAYAIIWDETLLEYIDSTNNFSGVNNFNTTNATNGELRVGWFEATALTLSDNDLLYTLNFNFLGNVGDVATLEIVNLPTYPIIIVGDGAQLDATQYEFNSGSVTRVENNPPVINDCPSTMLLTNDLGECGATVSFDLPTITEDCDVNIELVQISALGTGDFFPVGSNTLQYTATDNVGNTASCIFKIVILDAETPILSDCPENISASANAGTCAQIANWTVPTATDNCEVDGLVILSSTNDSGESFNVGTTTITYTATDTQGNSSECSFEVNIMDDESPVLIGCLEDISLPADAGLCGSIVTWIEPTATDNCGLESLVASQGPDTEFSTGTTTVTYTATDVNGNTADCSFDVTVVDSIVPMISCPNDILINPEANGCTTPVLWAVATATDNCPDVVITSTHTPGDIFSAGESIVTYTATDSSGNGINCSFSITVNGTNEINFVGCPEDQTVAAAVGACSASVTWNAPTVEDLCNGEPTLLSNYNPTDNFPIGSFVVIYTATLGNSSETCSFNVTVTGEEIITFSDCPESISINTDEAQCGANVSWTAPISASSCSANTAPTVTATHSSGDFFEVGTTTVTYTATGASGNNAVCSFDVIITDTEAGILIVSNCPTNIELDVSTTCNASANWTMPTASIPCSDEIPTMTSSHISGDDFSIGTTTVNITSSTIDGQSETCSFDVIVSDITAPSVTCPSDLLMTIPVGELAIIINDDLSLTSSDNCSAVSINSTMIGTTNIEDAGADVTGTEFNVGESTVTYSAQDDTGNIATCSFLVTIENEVTTEPTAFDCPNNLIINTDTGECIGTSGDLSLQVGTEVDLVLQTYSFSGATTENSEVTGINSVNTQAFNIGETTVNYTAETTTGEILECSFNVTVSDNESPILLDCPTGLEINLPAQQCDTTIVWAAPTATDNCTLDVAAISDIASGTAFTIGMHTVIYTASDESGNTATCAFEINITGQNGEGETTFATCPSNTIMAADTGVCGAAVNWDLPTIAGNCGFELVSPPFVPGDTFSIGITSLIYVLIDESGSSSNCTFIITVEDNELPQLTSNCPDDFVVNNDLGQCNALVNWTTPTFSDNCEVVEVISTHQPNQTYNVGNYDVVYTATDATGNTETCAFSFEVKDTEFPEIIGIVNDITVPNDQGECGANVTWNISNAVDNCQLTFAGSDYVPGEFFPLGQTLVTYTATDAAGNTSQESFSITVYDNEAPEFNCPANVVINADGTIVSDPSNIISSANPSGCNMVEINFTIPTAVDVCGSVTTTLTEGEFDNGDIFSAGSYTLEYTATDAYDNESICSIDFTVQEEQILEIVSDVVGGICVGEETKLCVEFLEGATYTWYNPNQEFLGVGQCVTLEDISMEDAGTYTVIVQVENGCSYTAEYNLLVYEVPSLSISVAPILCTDGSEDLEFFAEDNNNTNIVSWSWMRNGMQISTLQNLVIPNANPADAGIYTLIATNENNCLATETVTVDEITEIPVMPDLMATDQFICVGETTTLNVLNDNIYQGTNVEFFWSSPSGDSAGIPELFNNSIIEVSPTTGGNVTYFCYVVVDGCTSEQGAITIIQESNPILNIELGGNTNVDCVDGTTFITLTETGGEATTWNWYKEGTLISSENSITLENVTAATSGTYTVVSTTNNGCESTASTEISLNDLPTGLSASFTDNELCLDEAASLNFEGLSGSNVIYEITGDLTMTTTNNPVSIIGLGLGEHNLIITATVDGCPANETTATVTVQDAPIASIVQTGDTECVPVGSNLTLSAAVPGASYTWLKNNVTLGTEASLNLTNISANQTSGEYILVASSSFGCSATANQTINITDAVLPASVEFSNAGCLGEDIQLQAFDDNTNTEYRWIKDGEVVFFDRNPIITDVTEADAGEYQVVVINSSTLCTDTSEVALLNVLTAPEDVEQDFGLIYLPTTHIELTLTDNDNIPEGTDYTVTIFQQPEFGHVEILDASKGKVDYIRDTDRARTDRFFYEVCYDDCENACARAMVTIYIKYSTNECVTTNLISPNGDGTNDEFLIYCLDDGDFPDNELSVYNQWGDRVYFAAPYTNDWTGTYDGDDLPDGTYYYTFRRDASSEVKKGHLTIHR